MIYNSLVRERYEAICVRLRIIDYKRRNWILRDLHGKLITEVQINALDSNSSSNHTEEEACFMGTLAALSITQFTVELSDFDPHYEQSKQTWIRNFSDTKINANDEFEIESDRIRLSFGRNDGLLRHVTRFDNGGHEIERFKLRIDFVTYGTRIKKNTDHSGAYLFIPDEDEPQDLPYRDVRVLVIKGSLVSRVHIHLDGPLPIEHVLCVVQGEPWFNVRNLFHLKRGRFSNKELLMRLYSDVANDGLFYSDLNGLQITRRQYREKIPLQGNVYPMPSMAYLQDRRYRLTIVTAQPLGVTSHFSGNLDIFLDRLLLKDDQRGLGQGVTDNVLTQEWFRILVEPTSQDVFKPSLEAQTALLLMLHPPFQMHSNQQSNQGQLKFVRNELPCDLHVLNLRANLFASDEFHLFLHRFASTCESRCIESKVTLNDLLHPILRDLLDDRGTRRSLSLMHSKGDWNLTTDSIQVSSNDFEVITLRLKN